MDMSMVEIPAYSVASDENGAVLKRQVTDYMEIIRDGRSCR